MSADLSASAACPHLVVFAAQGIQTYILRSDKLREMSGASELVESMANELLDDTLRQLGFNTPDDVVLSRAAGAARIVFPNEACARDFARLWPLLADRHAPGLPVSIAIVRVDDHLVAAIEKAEELIPARRAQPLCELPAAGPFTLRHDRSGRPIERDFLGEYRRPADRETGRKHMRAESGRLRLLEKIIDHRPSQAEAYGHWPLEMEHIAPEGHGLGIFHADGNGLGLAVRKFLKQLRDLPDADARKKYREFCEGVTQATTSALTAALVPIVAKTKAGAMHPFRPLVCAGDDVTVILRDTDAVAFARAFLGKIQANVRTTLGYAGLGEFTACGALVLVRPKFPFADAYTLCESMCSDAKKRVDRRQTALSFLRVASSLPGDYHEFISRERTLPNGELLTMNPYIVGPLFAPAGLTSLDNLLTLLTQLQSLPRGALREVVAALYDSVPAANTAYARFLQVLDLRDPKAKAAFEKTFQALTGNAVGIWTAGLPNRTPLYDALELHAVSRRDEP
jgi:hypothetical protein